MLLVFYATAAFGIVYSWVDTAGIRHYVNRDYDIPERYRPKAKALYPEPSDTRTAPQGGQEQQKQAEAVASVSVQPASPPPPVAAPPQAPVASTAQADTVKPARKRRERRERESE